MSTQILRHIESTLYEGKRVHVLTGKQAEAAAIFKAASDHLRQYNISLVSQSTTSVTESPILVSPAVEMCFLCLRQGLHGQAQAWDMEGNISKAHALIVNVSPRERQTPCKITDCSMKAEGDACATLASMTLSELFEKYDTNTELVTGRYGAFPTMPKVNRRGQ